MRMNPKSYQQTMVSGSAKIIGFIIRVRKAAEFFGRGFRRKVAMVDQRNQFLYKSFQQQFAIGSLEILIF